MRAAGFQIALHKGRVAEALQHPVVGDGGFALAAVFKHFEAHAVVGVPPDVALYSAGVLGHVAPHQRPVGALYGMVEELPRQIHLGLVVLGHHQQPGGVLVYAVHQHAHALVGRIGLLADAQMIGQGIDQRAGEMPETRVDHQPGGLVHDQKVVVFVNYIQRYRLGVHLEAAALVRQHYHNGVQRLDLVVGLHRAAVDQDVLSLEGKLHAVARGLLHLAHYEPVYTQGGLPLVHHKTVVLEHLSVAAVLLQVLIQIVVQKGFVHHYFTLSGFTVR